MDYLPQVKMDFIPSDDSDTDKKVCIDENSNQEEIIVEPVKKSDSINPEEIFSFNEEEKNTEDDDKNNIQEEIKEVQSHSDAKAN